MCASTSSHLYGSPRTTCKSQFSPTMWILGTELKLHSKHPYPVNHLASPSFICLFTSSSEECHSDI